MGNIQFLAHFDSSMVQMLEGMAPAVGMIELSRFDQLGDSAISDPIVTFDEVAMRGGLKELVGRTADADPTALLEEEDDEDLIGTNRHEGTADREVCCAGHCERGPMMISGRSRSECSSSRESGSASSYDLATKGLAEGEWMPDIVARRQEDLLGIFKHSRNCVLPLHSVFCARPMGID